VTSCRTTVIAAFQDVREPGGSTASVRFSECDAVAGSKEPQAVASPAWQKAAWIWAGPSLR